MAKPKLRSVGQTKSAQRPAVAPAATDRPASPELVQLRRVWKQEVEELQRAEYESLDQAIAALVDRLTAKLGSTGEESGEEEREFLIELLRTDPEICDQLEKALKIRKPSIGK